MRVPLPTFLIVAFLVLGATAVLPPATAAPAVTSISPNTGSENGGTNITIDGSGFAAGATVCLQVGAWEGACDLDDLARRVIVTPTKITAVTPARAVGSNTPVNVIVSNIDGQTTIMTAGFTYLQKNGPTVTSFTPATGSSNGGTTVTIKGTNFEPNARPTVLFDAEEAPVVTVVDATTLRVITPAHPGNDAALITVKYASGTSPAPAASFFFAQAPLPNVSGVSPSSGGTNGGTQVTLTGTGFAPGATVKFGDAFGTKAFVTSPTTITVLSPPLKVAATSTSVGVTVVNPDGETGEDSAYTYRASPAPSVSTMLPVSGPEWGGQVVAISGSNFVAGTVLCASNPGTAPGTCPEPDTIQPTETPNAPEALCPTNACFPLPPGTGTKQFWILNPDGRSDAVPTLFTYVDSTRVTGITPASGTANGGVAVTIEGEDFVCSLNGVPVVVQFGGTPAFSVESCTASAIEVVTPGHAAGTVDVRVMNPNGLVAVYHKGFQFAAATTPKLDSLNVATGGANGGTAVTLTGSGFGCPPTLTSGPLPTVTFGTRAVSGENITACSATSITVRAPAQPASNALTVKVRNPSGGTEASKSSAFTYTSEAPTIASMGAHSGPTNGGTSFLITGTGFVCDDALGRMATVRFGTTPAHSVTPGTCVANLARGLSTTNQLTVVSPGHAPGAAPVKVTNPSGESNADAGAADDFTYGTAVNAPAVTGLSVSSGPTLGLPGTLASPAMTITGTGFACPAGGPEPLVAFKAASGDAGSQVHPDNVVCESATSIKVLVVPPHAAGFVNVLVANPSGQLGTLTDGFEYKTPSNAPSIQSIGIPTGTVLGGSSMLITSNEPGGVPTFYCNPLGPNATVRIGSTVVPAADVSLGAPCENFRTEKLVVKTPARLAGGVEAVIVRNPDGQEGSTGGFRYLDLPSLSKVTPASGSRLGGPVVKLEGANLAAGGSTLFDDVFAPVSAGAGTTATVKTPAGPLGLADVAFIDPFGQSATLANGYTYTPPVIPVATSISPLQGAVSGQTEVTINGANFLSGATVCFGPLVDEECPADLSVPATVIDSTKLTAKTPPHSLGTVDVTVINADGQPGVPMVQAFTFLGTDQLPVPAIATVQPSSGPIAGGTLVTINGTNFASNAVVKFGSANGTNVQFVNSTQLKVTTPPHAAGTVDVTVTVGVQSSLPKAGAFTFVGSTTTTTTGSGTNSDSSSSSSTGSPAPLTPAIIESTNLRIKVTVTREGDTNVIKWDLPSPPAGRQIMGIQIWRSNSPYTLVQDIPATDSDFGDTGEFRDSSDDALPTSKYLVTMYYGLSEALGQFADGHDFDEADYDGVAAVDPDGTDGDGSALPTWAIVLIALGILFLVVLVAVLIARGRNRDGQAAAQGYAWQEEGESKAAEGEWQPPAEVHQARCPACATSFTATGQKPIVTVCPGCGKKGILR